MRWRVTAQHQLAAGEPPTWLVGVEDLATPGGRPLQWFVRRYVDSVAFVREVLREGPRVEHVAPGEVETVLVLPEPERLQVEMLRTWGAAPGAPLLYQLAVVALVGLGVREQDVARYLGRAVERAGTSVEGSCLGVSAGRGGAWAGLSELGPVHALEGRPSAGDDPLADRDGRRTDDLDASPARRSARPPAGAAGS